MTEIQFLVQALKNREANSIVEAWTKINERLKKAGLQPKTLILDYECSRDLKTAFGKEKIMFQMVPPSTHRANAAERAIQTFKNHLKAGLASTDPKLPIREWDC